MSLACFKGSAISYISIQYLERTSLKRAARCEPTRHERELGRAIIRTTTGWTKTRGSAVRKRQNHKNYPSLLIYVAQQPLTNLVGYSSWLIHGTVQEGKVPAGEREFRGGDSYSDFACWRYMCTHSLHLEPSTSTEDYLCIQLREASNQVMTTGQSIPT